MRLLSSKDFDRKFQPIFRELELLHLKINKQQGWFIFKTHVWTKEELRKSEHISKIISISEKIGDDVNNWRLNKQLSFIEKGIYNQKRDRVDDELQATKIEIEERQETSWEKFANTFAKVIPEIMNYLPEIRPGNIASKLLGNVFTALLPESNRNNRRLPASR